MSASLLLPVWLAMASPAVPGPTSHPAVHIWLNSDGQFVRGDHARVYLKTADDGYVVVLRADDQGRVRVLYPADPTGDDYVQATDKLEIHGRDNGKAFLVNDKSGGGLVVAAYSQQPFTFNDYVLNGHWDLTALTPAGAKRDPEAAVMNVVQTMSTGHPFEYDEAEYVTRAPARARPYRLGFGFGPWYYGPWYSSPWYYGAWNYDPYCIACSPYFGFAGPVIIGRSVEHEHEGHAFMEGSGDHDAPAGRAEHGRR